MADDDERVIGAVDRVERRADALVEPGVGILQRQVGGHDPMAASISSGVSSSQQEGSCQAPWIRQKVAMSATPSQKKAAPCGAAFETIQKLWAPYATCFTPVAAGPFGPCSVSYSTFAPSSSER